MLIATLIASWTSIDFRIPGSTSYRQPFLIAEYRPLILEQKDQLASRSVQRRTRSNGAGKNVAHFAASQSLQTALQRAHETPGVREPSSIYIKGGLGAISSSRCQTAHACQANPGGRGFFITSGRANGSLPSAPSGSSQRSNFADGSDKNFGGKNDKSLAPGAFAPKPQQKWMPDQNAPEGCLSGRAPRPTIGSQPPVWWSQTGSNRRPPACKAGALPTELWPLRGSVTRDQQSEAAAGKGHLITDT
jgi:hypothetical protein